MSGRSDRGRRTTQVACVDPARTGVSVRVLIRMVSTHGGFHGQAGGTMRSSAAWLRVEHCGWQCAVENWRGSSGIPSWNYRWHQVSDDAGCRDGLPVLRSEKVRVEWTTTTAPEIGCGSFIACPGRGSGNSRACGSATAGVAGESATSKGKVSGTQTGL
jgi:hypothetical protein